MLSVAAVTFYAILTLAMGHNECRFDKPPPPPDDDDDEEEDDPKITDPAKLPNVTSTVQLCFMVGLSLHVLLFFVVIFFETHWRYYLGERSKQGFMAV